jgi:hypothetical protein
MLMVILRISRSTTKVSTMSASKGLLFALQPAELKVGFVSPGRDAPIDTLSAKSRSDGKTYIFVDLGDQLLSICDSKLYISAWA